MSGIPYCERKHSAQPSDTIISVLLIEMNNDLGIAGRFELMATVLKITCEFAVVVNLTVEHDDNAAVFVIDGLSATGYIDDTETARAQPDCWFKVQTLPVGPPVTNALQHSSQALILHWLAGTVLINPTDS